MDLKGAGCSVERCSAVAIILTETWLFGTTLMRLQTDQMWHSAQAPRKFVSSKDPAEQGVSLLKSCAGKY